MNTWEVALAQCGLRPRGNGRIRRSQNIHAVGEISRTAFSLHLGRLWGFAVDQIAVGELDKDAREKLAAGEARFRSLGFVRGDGTKDGATIKRSVAVAYDASEPCHEGCAQSKEGERPSDLALSLRPSSSVTSY